MKEIDHSIGNLHIQGKRIVGNSDISIKKGNQSILITGLDYNDLTEIIKALEYLKA